MTTCRDVIGVALSALGAVAPGGQPTVDELGAGLDAMTGVVLSLHEARGPLVEVDVSSDFVASEDQRLRVVNGFTVAVTLPNSIAELWNSPNWDYGFTVQPYAAFEGSTLAADGTGSRAPRDGARVEIVGSAPAIYFFRSDINAWVLSNPLSLDSATPLNARYDGPMAALVAERLADAMNIIPTPGLVKRIARSNTTLMLRPGIWRGPARSSYL